MTKLIVNNNKEKVRLLKDCFLGVSSICVNRKALL